MNVNCFLSEPATFLFNSPHSFENANNIKIEADSVSKAHLFSPNAFRRFIQHYQTG